jgi:hypothetical protein
VRNALLLVPRRGLEATIDTIEYKDIGEYNQTEKCLLTGITVNGVNRSAESGFCEFINYHQNTYGSFIALGDNKVSFGPIKQLDDYEVQHTSVQLCGFLTMILIAYTHL